tara:strand:- start:531 stop:1388 length:858 start_codon:yes stop_codon:yes gene_type:complete
MSKHNKKRNVGLVYELLCNHMSECLVDNKIKNLKIATSILEKRFKKGTELYKEFRLFNALAKTTASDTHIVASILSEAKNAARSTDIKKLEKEKSDLIREINYRIKDKKFYYRNVSNYRDLATIQIMLNEWRKNKDNQNIQRLVEYEQKLVTHLLKEKHSTTIDEEKKKLDASDSNRLIYKIMTEKINKKYHTILTEDQKEIIRNYVLYGDDKKQLEFYLTRKKKEVKDLLENFESEENNKFLVEKVDHVRARISALNVKEHTDASIMKFLTLTSLISTLKTTEK